MLKQPASRNQRYKGFKVDHVLQICALLALCIWLLNQVRNSYDNKGSGIFRTVMSKHSNGATKLGGKGLDPQGKVSTAEMNEGEVEVEEEVEKSEDNGRGSGDDEIGVRNQEKVEGKERGEVTDLIDEEDKEKENRTEDLSILEDQSMIIFGVGGVPS